MNDDTPVSLLEAQVDEVLAEYLEAERLGNAPDPEELIARHPHLAAAIKEFLADRLCVAPLLVPQVKPRQTSAKNGQLAATVEAGRYVDLTFHARGGLGVVSRATDTELHRTVAHKRIRNDCADDEYLQRRFLLEAEVTARLEHPGVVPVYSLYRDDQGCPCYTMRFIEGENLEEALDEYHGKPPDPVEFRRLLQSFIQVCETVAYAHSRGVIHRDLKPKNIMRGKFGETLVVDWGLAKIVGRKEEVRTDGLELTLRPVSVSAPMLTQMGRALGTWAYMSPEQAAGRWDVIDAASDVYNLGAVLYQLLTGRAPIEAANEAEAQQKIQQGDFARPRTVKPGVPRALEAVCLRAMAMKPENRYPSARELAAEIEQWLADEPVKAYREPVQDRAWRWVRKNKGMFVGGLMSLFIGLIATVVGSRLIIQEKQKATYANLRWRGEQSTLTKGSIERLTNRHGALLADLREGLDSLAAQISHDSRFNELADRNLRNELLQKTLAFWEQAISHENNADNETPSFERNFYSIQRALCLARLGEYSKAAMQAKALEEWATTREPKGEAAFDLARVYALCAEAAKSNDELSCTYADQAMQFLRKAHEQYYFRHADGQSTTAKLSLDHPDLGAIRAREDMARFVKEIQAKK